MRNARSICCFSRYLVDCHWFKQWKKFVGYDTWDVYGAGDKMNNPGPIDNSSLLAGKNKTLLTLFSKYFDFTG